MWVKDQFLFKRVFLTSESRSNSEANTTKKTKITNCWYFFYIYIDYLLSGLGISSQ